MQIFHTTVIIMIEEKHIDELQKRLMQLGTSYITLIAEKVNMSRTTIYKFFNREKIRNNNALKIYDAALEVLQEVNLQDQSRKQKARRLLEDNAEQTGIKFNH